MVTSESQTHHTSNFPANGPHAHTAHTLLQQASRAGKLGLPGEVKLCQVLLLPCARSTRTLQQQQTAVITGNEMAAVDLIQHVSHFAENFAAASAAAQCSEAIALHSHRPDDAL